MEIITAPYRPASSTWRRVLVLVAVLAPVTLLALLPMGLGLDRYVMTGDSMAPAIHRGSVVLERDVPVGDLRVGDVVTFHPPSDFDVAGPVTSLPYVGYLYLALAPPAAGIGLALILVGALGVAATLGPRRRATSRAV